MHHIVIHCKPKESNEEYFGKVMGAYVSILLDYKDYEGALALSKFYVTENGWDIFDIEEEYYTFENKDDLPEDYQQYFEEVKEFGYSLIFSLYNEEADE